MREYLNKLRTERGMTLQSTADALGITKSYYQFIENGERQRKMDITLASKISAIFGISLEGILEEERKWSESEQTEEVSAEA